MKGLIALCFLLFTIHTSYSESVTKDFEACMIPILEEGMKQYDFGTFALHVYMQCNPDAIKCAQDLEHKIDTDKSTLYDVFKDNNQIDELKLGYYLAKHEANTPNPFCNAFEGSLDDSSIDFTCYDKAYTIVRGCIPKFTNDVEDTRTESEKQVELFNKEDCGRLKNYADCSLNSYHSLCPNEKLHKERIKFYDRFMENTGCKKYY